MHVSVEKPKGRAKLSKTLFLLHSSNDNKLMKTFFSDREVCE
jgi:hypothetical protein